MITLIDFDRKEISFFKDESVLPDSVSLDLKTLAGKLHKKDNEIVVYEDSYKIGLLINSKMTVDGADFIKHKSLSVSLKDRLIKSQSKINWIEKTKEPGKFSNKKKVRLVDIVFKVPALDEADYGLLVDLFQGVKKC